MSIGEKLLAVAQKQQTVYHAGYEKGHASGYDQGHANGYAEGYQVGEAQATDRAYEAGEKACYDRFWDAYQEEGNKTNYRFAFAGPAWTDETYKPKYPIVAVYTNSANAECTMLFTLSGITDTKVPITLRSELTSAVYGSIFNYARSLVTVPLLEFDGDFVHTNSNFQGAINLENITFGGSIVQSGLNISYCTKLTVDSLISLISCLADYSQDTSGATRAVTLGTINLNKLTDAQKAIATQKGWTLA